MSSVYVQKRHNSLCNSSRTVSSPFPAALLQVEFDPTEMGNTESCDKVTSSDMTLSARSDIQASTRSMMHLSNRSVRSSGSGSTPATSHSLHGNLMRTHKHRDPYRIYEVLEVLGEGSMGHVSRVQRKTAAEGGSARWDFVKEHGDRDCCFGFSWMVLPPKRSRLLVERANSTLTTDGEDDVDNSTQRSVFLRSKSTPTTLASNHKVLYKKQSSCITYGSSRRLSYALKSIHLDRCSSPQLLEELRNEVKLLKMLDHSNIVRAMETYHFKNRMYLVLELCNGGDLYTRDPYTESHAQSIALSLYSAVAYLHSKGIVHRDIKYENVMFTNQDSYDVKLIDFGLSRRFAADEHLHDAVGTVYTMAPELVRGDYNEKCDVWSLGVIVFMLLSSSMPFYGQDRTQVLKRILHGKYSFAGRRWKTVSYDAKAFVHEMLVKSVADRPSAAEAMQFPWLDVSPENQILDIDAKWMDDIQSAIHAFAGYSTLKKLALLVVAFNSTSAEIGHLKAMFQQIDTDKNGELSLDEFKQCLSSNYDFSDEEIENLYRGIDVDATQSVHYMEFLAATMEVHGTMDEQRLAQAFDRIDCDDSGYITVRNLRDFLGDDMPEEYLDGIIDEADLTRDHRISYDEFLALWDDIADRQIRQSREKVSARRKVVKEESFGSTSPTTTTTSLSDDYDARSDASCVGSGVSFYNQLKRENSRKSMRAAWI